MTFQRDDVVVNKQGVLGIVIGAGVTLSKDMVYICEIPNGNVFTFFLGTEENIKHYTIQQKPVKRSVFNFSLMESLENIP